MKRVISKADKKKMKLVKVIIILVAAVSLIMSSLLILFSCSSGVDVGELDKILTSFSIQWPEGFDYDWYTRAQLPITINALDQNGETFNWEGLVDLYTTNPEVFVFPKTASLANGSITTNLQFYIYAFEEELDTADTLLQLRYQDIMTPLSSNIHVDKLIKPYASFVADVTRGDTPLTVQFNDNSTGHILNWEWDFNNDEVIDSTEKNPVYNFNAPGNYTVMLKVTGPSGALDADFEMKSRYILAGEDVPLANFTATNVSGYPPLTVDFTDLSQGNVTSWAWYFNGDEVVDSTEQNPSYEYNDPGYYPVTLTVSGPDGSDSVTLNYYIMVYGFFSALGDPGFSAGGASNITLYVDNGTLYVAYTDSAYSGKSPSGKATVKLYNGTHWETVGIEGFSEGDASYTSFYVDDGTPYVAYSDSANANKATVMKFNGTIWVPVGSEGFSAGQADYVSLAVDSSNTPYVAYQDGGNTNKATVMEYTGGGDTGWEAVGSEGFSAGRASYTSLYMYSDTPYVTYMDGAYSDKSTIMKFNGTIWEVVGSEGFSGGEAAYTSVVVYNGTPYIAYSDGISSSKATVLMYNESGWHVVGKEGISEGGLPEVDTEYLSLYVYNDTPYVAYRDEANDSKVTVLKFNGMNWETVGIEGFTAGEADYLSLYVYEGTPYLAYQDDANLWKATVMKYNGASWEAVGSPGFSEGFAYFLSLYVYEGSPYVAYIDYAYPREATVMKYTGNTTTDSDAQPNDGWEYVGSPGLSAGNIAYPSLYVYSGTPYVAYRDIFNSYKATVMKFNGTSWEAVGIEGFSENRANDTSLYVYNGTPYIGFRDFGQTNKVSVMKYNGTIWEYVGSRGFTPATTSYLSLHMYNGTPYVAYRDGVNPSYKASVMKFNGTSWEDAGTPGFSAGEADHTSLFVYNGTPYVAYRDWANSKKVTVMRLW